GVDEGLINDMKKAGIHPDNVRLLPDGNGWLLVEFGGDSRAESDAKVRAAMDALSLKPNRAAMESLSQPTDQQRLWEGREAWRDATAQVPGEPVTWEGFEDSAVPPDRVGDYLRDLRKLYQKFEYSGALYGHFGQGCIHTRIDFDLQTAAGIEKYRRF